MKWFFALNQASGNFEHIADMVKVAVHSAQKHTSLEPYFLFDGVENELTHWLRARGVTVIFRRSWLYEELSQLAAQTNKPHILEIGSGAFLRTEIPSLSQEMGFADETVLYTDCDVLFFAEVVPELSALKPRLFAIAPEDDPNNHLLVNSGVMVMNLPGLLKHEKRFRRFVLRHLDSCCRHSWDQTAYIWYYHSLMRQLLSLKVEPEFAMRACRALYRRKIGPSPLWDALPIEYNWKPYWEKFDHAKILHFHGPKPYERDILRSGDAPPHLNHLLSMMGGSYNELSDIWMSALAEATS